MRNVRKIVVLGTALGLAAVGTAGAANINVGNPLPGAQAADLITVSRVFTANNVYNLRDQIYVMPGATLIIEAGTRIASTPSANGSGSLAVTRGGRIMVLGTKTNPVVMTSTADNGTWREAANEWGNLTIMGDALISASLIATNTSLPDGTNEAPMEGLTPSSATDTKVLYGGNNDDDDSGVIEYLSIRYGGRVLGLGNELNGLSLGGVGRETDIHHVEVMNNVDDGIEIWGGTVNLEYISVWNVGDDSFDVDQGWRGKAQFLLLVQGYSLDQPQGSGVGDNVFEVDGAEDSDAQPVTVASIYNCTVIGQPGGGDAATAWRDGARVQYRNCIFMDLGAELVLPDDPNGGGQGYGFNSTLTFPQVWTTSYTYRGGPVNAIVPIPPLGTFNHPLTLYQAQVDGRLAEIRGSIMFNNLAPAAYTEATARGVFVPANGNQVATVSPIRSITRAPQVLRGNLPMRRVTGLDPRASNDAIGHTVVRPLADGFLKAVSYAGAFAPAPTENWLQGWTAADEFGMLLP